VVAVVVETAAAASNTPIVINPRRRHRSLYPRRIALNRMRRRDPHAAQGSACGAGIRMRRRDPHAAQGSACGAGIRMVVCGSSSLNIAYEMHVYGLPLRETEEHLNRTRGAVWLEYR